jgi:hypothetical protein
MTQRSTTYLPGTRYGSSISTEPGRVPERSRGILLAAEFSHVAASRLSEFGATVPAPSGR